MNQNEIKILLTVKEVGRSYGYKDVESGQYLMSNHKCTRKVKITQDQYNHFIENGGLEKNLSAIAEDKPYTYEMV